MITLLKQQYSKAMSQSYYGYCNFIISNFIEEINVQSSYFNFGQLYRKFMK